MAKGDAFRFRIVGIESLSEEHIEKHFAAYGEVLGVEFARDPFTNQLTGNGSVRISGFKEDAKKQIFEDRHEIAGNAVTISDDYERKIFIGGFKDVDPDIVRDYFKAFGDVEEFDVAFREKNGRPRGYAFLRFVTAASMESALAAPNHTIEGRQCVAKRAEARPFILPKDRPLSKQARKRGNSCSRSCSRSRSRSKEGRRRGSRGGLQIAPGYSYEDGIGARPTWAQQPMHGPPHYGHGWPAPPHTGYSHPPPPGYGGYGPYVDYGRPPPGHGHPSGYGSPPYSCPPPDAYGRPPPDAYSRPPPDAYGRPPPDAYGRAPLDAYGRPLPGYGPAPSPAYRQPPPGHGYGPPPGDYGHPPPGYTHPPAGYGPPGY